MGRTCLLGPEKKEIFIYYQQPDGNWGYVQTLRCCSLLSSILSSSDDAIDCFVLSPDNSFLIAACGDRMHRFVFDPSNKLFKYDSRRNADTGSPRGVGLMALSSGGKYLVFSGSRDCHAIHIWKPNDGASRSQMQPLGRFPMLDIIGQSTLVTGLGFGPDDQLAVGLDNGTFCIFNAMGSNGKLLSRLALEPFKCSIISVSWNADGRILVGTGTGLFLRSSKGIVKRVDRTDLKRDSECWVDDPNKTNILRHGTSRGQAGRCVLNEDRLTAMEGAYFPVVAGTKLGKLCDKITVYPIAWGGPGTSYIGMCRSTSVG